MHEHRDGLPVLQHSAPSPPRSVAAPKVQNKSSGSTPKGALAWPLSLNFGDDGEHLMNPLANMSAH